MVANETLDRLWNCATGDATQACFPYQRCLALEPWPDFLKIQLAENAGDQCRIIVATQAIEAGVDVTSAVMFTELAPWASLVQRFGRLNRGGEEVDAHAFWIDIAAGAEKDAAALALPYAPEELEASRKRLGALKDVSPQTLEPFGLDLDASWRRYSL